MPDLATLITRMRGEGYFARAAENRQAQFGTPNRRLLGAELLPEMPVQTNVFRDQAIRFRSVIANAGPRYGAAQKKGNALLGTFLVELGNSDISWELTAEHYDALNALMNQNLDMDAMMAALDLFDRMVLEPLRVHNEKNRWDAIVSSQVLLRGDNDLLETVQLYNPSGHRSNAGGQWSDDDYDPFDDIGAKVDLLTSKGFGRISRIITARPVYTIMANNAKVKARVGGAVLTANGTLMGLGGRASLDAINNAFDKDDLPPMELYDLTYNTEEGTGYYLDRASMVFIGASDEQIVVDLGDGSRILENVLGYTAVGKPAGKNTPGPKTYVQHFEDKPPRVVMEGWQTSFPVVRQPEAIGVIAAIN